MSFWGDFGVKIKNNETWKKKIFLGRIFYLSAFIGTNIKFCRLQGQTGPNEIVISSKV